MADTGSSKYQSESLPGAPAPKRVHSYSRFTTAIAVLGLATAIYTLLRLDSTRDRLDQVRENAHTLQTENNSLRKELANLAVREQQARQELLRKFDALSPLPQQVQELDSIVADLKGRATGPERAWSRAEALFLLETAQRRLTLDRDVTTAISALESADVRLGALRDASFSPVRQQIAKDLQALRTIRQPDLSGILNRLTTAEEQALRMPVKGIVAVERTPGRSAALPDGAWARARAMVSNTLHQLITVRAVDSEAASIVTAEEQLLRRQHLQLLLFSARTAAVRHDNANYRSSLASARSSLGEFFDLSAPAAGALLAEIQALEPIDVDPPLPDISATLALLQRMTSMRPGPE